VGKLKLKRANCENPGATRSENPKIAHKVWLKQGQMQKRKKGRAGVSDTSAENCSASHKANLNSRSKIQNAAREAGCIKQRPVMPCDLLVVLRDANAQEAAPHHDTTVQHSLTLLLPRLMPE